MLRFMESQGVGHDWAAELSWTDDSMQSSQGALVVKNPAANAGDVRDMGSIPGLGRSSGGGHGNPLQYSCLKNPMGGRAWRATVHRSQSIRHD